MGLLAPIDRPLWRKLRAVRECLLMAEGSSRLWKAGVRQIMLHNDDARSNARSTPAINPLFGQSTPAPAVTNTAIRTQQHVYVKLYGQVSRSGSRDLDIQYRFPRFFGEAHAASSTGRKAMLNALKILIATFAMKSFPWMSECEWQIGWSGW